MHIIADENIPYVKQLFENIGSVKTRPGRHLTASDLATAEILLVRSVTPVTAQLLANSHIRFVGTATIGYDHIDVDYLHQQHIGFARAPGCNATAAAEYVISALLTVAEYQDFSLTNRCVGIIGCGQVGGRVWQKLQALGVPCLLHDPPLQQQTARSDFVDLKTILTTSDIITLHVPLETQGDYPTYQLVNRQFLDQLPERAIVINTSRGAVVDEQALLTTLLKRPTLTAILDVWAQEPYINQALLEHAQLATPHIAGYSFDGKVRGTEMLYQALCDYFGLPQTASIQALLPPPPLTQLSFSATVDDWAAIRLAVRVCYDIRGDDARLRLMRHQKQPHEFFDNLRKNYPKRREFHSLQIQLPATQSHLATTLGALGFRVTETKEKGISA